MVLGNQYVSEECSEKKYTRFYYKLTIVFLMYPVTEISWSEVKTTILHTVK